MIGGRVLKISRTAGMAAEWNSIFEEARKEG